ncbi:HEAT repeat domain-containing protein [Prosthecobacter sp.]|uniref:HEAT repeat domain-containing protein n=1 Tax=Prosthecobacter sp. TaxID=1965333 RepID=UPI003784D8B7
MNRRRLIIASASSVVVMAAALLFFAMRQPASETKPGVQKKMAPSQAGLDTAPVQNPGTVVQQPSVQTKAEVLAEVALAAADPSMGRRLAMVEKLAALGPGFERLLGDALQAARSNAERAVLADALARIGTGEAVQTLFAAVHSASDPAARAQLLQALNALPPGQPLETLASTLALPLEPQVRDAVVATISRAADANTVQFLGEMYHEPEAAGGQSANILAALGSITNPGSTSALSTLLRTSGEVPIMQNAAASLGKIGTSDSLQAVADSLHVIGATNPELRQSFLNIIQSVTSTEARDWLQKNATSTDPGLAQAASAALGAMQSSATQ